MLSDYDDYLTPYEVADELALSLTTVYTKHHLKFGKNQADNLAYIGFRRRFFPVFYWCLVLQPAPCRKAAGS